MGEVYLAQDIRLNRPVAIKLLPAHTIQNEQARRRFLQEARAASALNHPNVVIIYSIEETDEFDFIVMEYVEGETLRSKLERGPLELTDWLDTGIQLADALAAAHSAGLIHRDIKPSNILITPRNQVKILDFGLAKRHRPLVGGVDKEAETLAADLTDEGTILGTVHYMSPEQTRGEPLDVRSDIFSLGVVLYEMATGKTPFNGPSLLSVMHEIAAVNPQPPSAAAQGLPRDLDFILERALAKDKGSRYPTASELADALRALKGLESTGIPAVAGVKETFSQEGEPGSFVGRETELKRLDDLLRQVVEGRGRLLFVTGEPGIGKTALVNEFLHRVRQKHPQLMLCRGRCVEQYGTGEAYLPFLDALGRLLAERGRERVASALRTFAPTWCLQLPAAFASSGSLEKLQQETIGATKERMLREMGDALEAITAVAPLTILLEDLHWADTSSVELLRHLCQRIERQRLLIIGTFRPEDVALTSHPLKTYKLEIQAHNQCDEIALDSLGQEYIASYINQRFAPNDFPRELSALIYHKTEGHPLFATNLVQYMADRGDIVQTNAHWSLSRPLAEMELEAPESVRSLLHKKIEALNAEDRRALQYASVEGEEFLSTVVAKLLGVDDVELEERLDRLARINHLIKTLGEEELPDGELATRYRFAHALYQNVLYGDLVGKRRILLHRQAGEQLLKHYGSQSPRIAVQLALHFERGRDFGRAIEYFIHAGDNATKLYANIEAEEHYSHALGLVEKLPPEEQSVRYATVYQKRGEVNFALSRFQQAIDDFTEMLSHARTTETVEQEATALNALARTLFFSHRLEEMAARADEAVSAAERAGSSPALRAETMALVALKRLCYGELAEAEPLMEELIRIASSIGHKPALLSGLAWRGALYFFQSEYEQAEDFLTRANELASELRDPFLLLETLFFLGLSRGNMGRMSEALTTLRTAIKTAGRNGDQFWFPRIFNCIGWIYRELQDFDKALEYDQQGVSVSRQHHVLEAEANSLINLGIDYTNTAQGEKTGAIFREVEAIFERDAWFRWRYNIRLQAGICEQRLKAGDLELATEHAERLLAVATDYSARKYVAVAHKLLAHIAISRGDLTKGEAELKSALAVAQEYPAPLVAWRTYAALGSLYSQTGDGQAAREAFNQAAIIIEVIANSVVDEKLRSTFLDSRVVREVLKGKEG